MLVDLKRTVAYICPVCSNISSRRISVFTFSGRDKIKLICPTHGCHEECASVSVKGDKYVVSIECPLCGEKHSYTSSMGSFWHKELLSYKCPAAGIDVFFAGGSREVQKAIEDSTETYSDAIADIFDAPDADDEWGLREDYSILFEILDRLNSLNLMNKIKCHCGSANIEITPAGEMIMLQCADCRRSKYIESSDEMLTRLLNTNQLLI